MDFCPHTGSPSVAPRNQPRLILLPGREEVEALEFQRKIITAARCFHVRHQDLCFPAWPRTTMIFLSIPDWLTFPPISQGRHYAVIQTEPPQVLLTHVYGCSWWKDRNTERGHKIQFIQFVSHKAAGADDDSVSGVARALDNRGR